MMAFATVGMFVYSSWALFLVSFGEAQGLSPLEAVYLSTTAGIGGTLGSITASILFSFHAMNAVTTCMLPSLANGLSLLFSVYLKHFGVLSFLMFVSGFAQGLQYGGMAGFIPTLTCDFHLEKGLISSSIVEGFLYQIGGIAAGKMSATFYTFQHEITLQPQLIFFFHLKNVFNSSPQVLCKI